MTRPNNFKHKVTIIVFLLAVCLPLLEMKFKFGPHVDLKENRTLAARPAFAWSEAFAYPKRFDQYFSDNFGFRDLLIQTNARLKLNCLKVSPVASIMLGKNGWCFYNSDAANDGDTVADFRGTSPFSPDQVSQVRANLEAKIKLLSGKGIHYVVVIAPNKNTVYPEYFPDAFNKVTKQNKLDQVKGIMSGFPEADMVDVRQCLIKAKEKFPVYYRNGTHWNDYGAFVAWQEVVKTLSKYYPGLKQRSESEYSISTFPNNKDDSFFLWLGLADSVYGESVSVTPNVAGSNPLKLRKVVLFCDSFGDALKKFMGDHFENIVFKQYSRFDSSVIASEAPDVVITEITERHIFKLLNDYSGDAIAQSPPVKNRPIEAASNLTPFNLTDQNWTKGVSRTGDTAFFVLNSGEMQKALTPGKRLMFADGSVRKIERTRINDQYLNVYLDGAPLDGEKVGYPNTMKLVTSKH